MDTEKAVNNDEYHDNTAMCDVAVSYESLTALVSRNTRVTRENFKQQESVCYNALKTGSDGCVSENKLLVRSTSPTSKNTKDKNVLTKNNVEQKHKGELHANTFHNVVGHCDSDNAMR